MKIKIANIYTIKLEMEIVNNRERCIIENIIIYCTCIEIQVIDNINKSETKFCW